MALRYTVIHKAIITLFLLSGFLEAQTSVGAQAQDTKLRLDPPTLPLNMSNDIVPLHRVTMTLGENIIGFITYCTYRSNPTTAGLYSFYVMPEHRGKGYGRRILSYTIDHLTRQGFAIILIIPGPFEYRDNVLVELDIATHQHEQQQLIKLYESLGFVADQQHKQWAYKPQRPYSVTALAAVLLTMIILVLLIRRLYKALNRTPSSHSS